MFHRQLDIASSDDNDVDAYTKDQGINDVPVDDEDDIDLLYGLDHYDSDDNGVIYDDDDEGGDNINLTTINSYNISA